jgi:hypothetical protein
MNRSLDQLNQDFDTLLTRVGAIDGQGLPVNVKGQLANLSALISGLKKTLGNVNLGYKQDMQNLTNLVNQLDVTVKTLTGGS